MKTYTFNQELYRYINPTSVWNEASSIKMRFDEQTGVKGIPSQIMMKFFLNSGGFTANKSEAKIRFFDSSNSIIGEYGIELDSRNVLEQTLVIDIPPGTVDFCFYSKVYLASSRAIYTLIDATYPNLESVPVNKLVFNAINTSYSFVFKNSGSLHFSTYSGREELPVEIDFSLSLSSDATGSDQGFVRIYFFDAGNKLISQGGLTITGPGVHTNVPYRAKVPENAVTFIIESRTKAFIQGTKVNGSASVTIVDMTYEVAAQAPEIVEINITTSAASFITSICRALETIKSAAIQTFNAETAIEVQKNSYSHVEPLHTAATKHALLMTSTKGNTISTIAFTNVKTTSSSLMEPIHSENKATIGLSRTVTSAMKDVLTRSERASSAVRHVSSRIDSAKSVSKATKSKQSIFDSHMRGIHTSDQVIKAKNATVSSSVASIKTELSKKAVIKKTFFSASYRSSSLIQVKDRPTKIDVFVASRVTSIASDTYAAKKAHATSESHTENVLSHKEIKVAANTKSSVAAITAKAFRQSDLDPLRKTFTLTSNVGHIHSNIRRSSSREVMHQSHANKSFSSVLLSYKTDVASAMSNITSGAAVKRSSVSVIADVDSTVRPIAINIIIERRKLKMRLNELKMRLRIPEEDTSNDELLLIYLDDALDFIQRNCKQEFDPLPPTAKKVATQYVAFELNGNGYVLSETISGMSQTFESSEQRDKSLTSILRKAGLIKLRFA
ncbi:phage head-tail connector protein [Pseudobacillus badius]|uniref:phage head-tail connector protein n=1 Tax=Bacillus badius TaxID=1455 RepID=UPI0007B3DB1B|nr:phage head-tail connector protein [Bacillus badius]KZR58966.1 hypothetical protein A3781_00210 [Bacillus badius]